MTSQAGTHTVELDEVGPYAIVVFTPAQADR